MTSSRLQTRSISTVVNGNVGFRWMSRQQRTCWVTGSSRFPGFSLYYPSRRQEPAALSALINALRL